MGETTKIEWTTHSASPWYGCTKISPGCAHCYAAGWAKRAGKDIWGKGKPRQKSKSFEANCRKWNREAGEFPYKCPRCGLRIANPEIIGQTWVCSECGDTLSLDRPTVFPSLCDPFDSEVDIAWFADYLRVVFETPNLTHLLLTKRPENWRGLVEKARNHLTNTDFMTAHRFNCWLCDTKEHRPPSNVHVGTSIENSDYLRRAGALVKIPAVKRFLSLEPLLGPLDLSFNFCKAKVGDGSTFQCGPCPIDGVIIGGESGPGYRPMQIEWVESIVQQCDAAGVKVFVKQDCDRWPGTQGRLPAHLWARKEMP